MGAFSLMLRLPLGFAAEDGAPLKLVGTVPLPALGEGDVDYFAKEFRVKNEDRVCRPS